MAHLTLGSKVPDLSVWLFAKDMRKWLVVAVLFCLSLLVLLRCKVLERPSGWTYLDISSDFSPVPLNAHYEKVNDRLASPMDILPTSVNSTLFLGLANYTSLTNISDLNVVSLWKHLEPVLHHPISFREAKQGMIEAAVAWGDLLLDLKSQDMTKKNNSNKEKHCPNSVSFINNTDTLHRNKSILLIPCGLIVDSSITVIGVPRGPQGNFAFELLGHKVPGDSDAPIILHYNVRLLGDQITDKPVIVQNTWTRDHGWDDEERCPSDDELDERKVDALNICSQQIARSAILNLKDSIAGVWPATFLKENRKPWFPFANGLKFVATLWVGWEGFHMTVNGKHVTSFQYRQNLEPSSVTSLTFVGNIEPISVLANGLPTSEEIDLNYDFEFLKAPPLSLKTKKELFIGIFSTGNNFDRRMAIRRSWMQYDAVKSGAVVARFFVGLHNNKQVNKELWKEAARFGDIQLMPFVDHYNIISLKTIAICIFGTKMVNSKYIMKTDDDTFIRVDEVLHSLNKTKYPKGLLYGSLEFDARPHRDIDSKWFITNNEWSGSFYPPYAQGPGYIISNDIAKFIVLSHEHHSLKFFKLEDVSVGIWIEEFRKQGHKVHYSHDGRFYNLGCEEGYVTAHYQKPRTMLCLWQKIIEGLGPVCCE